MVKLDEVVRIADRHAISNVATAELASAALVAFGLITTEDKHLVIDKSKVRRWRKHVRDAQVGSLSFDGIEGIYFDGRIDETLALINGVKRVIKEDHISFIHQPNSQYIGHKAVTNGTARTILDALEELCVDKQISFDDIVLLGCDGTAVNTGREAGVIRLFELKHGPVQWSICMAHMNELPLRSLIEKLDGPFKSKNKLSGPIGERLNTCESLEIAHFEPITFPCYIPDAVSQTLSTDQKYLYDICKAISDGQVCQKLAKRSIGTLSKVRWTTIASRVLRVYVSEESPSPVLRTMANFIVLVYAPTMFELKHKSSIVFGSIHLAGMVRALHFLPQNALEIAKDSIARNAYFAHPEHVVMSMLNDENETIRLKGWRKVLSGRQLKLPGEIRKFTVPKLNFDCTNYLDLIEIDSFIDTDPPVLRKLPVSEDDLEYYASKQILDHDFGSKIKDMPLHTQSVERCVKLVTAASMNVCGEKSRDGFISTTLASRNEMPTYNSKKDFSFGKKFTKLSV